MGATAFPVQAQAVPPRSAEPHVRVRYVVPAFARPEDHVGVEDSVGVEDRVGVEDGVGVEDRVGAGDRVGVGDGVRVEDFERVEDYLRAYLGDERFRSAYFPAYERWSDASAMLYRAGRKDNLLVAAQRARETIAGVRPCPGRVRGAGRVESPRDRDAARRSVGRDRDIPARGWETLVATSCSRCSSIGGFSTMSSSAQAHGARQEVGEPLRWEDARRVVVLTALVMVEIDRSL